MTILGLCVIDFTGVADFTFPVLVSFLCIFCLFSFLFVFCFFSSFFIYLFFLSIFSCISSKNKSKTKKCSSLTRLTKQLCISYSAPPPPPPLSLSLTFSLSLDIYI